MFCPKCGNEISADTKFCPTCGEQIGKEPVAEKAEEKSASQKADGKKILLLVLIAVAVLLQVSSLVKNIKGLFTTEMSSEATTDAGKMSTSSKGKRGFSSYEDAIDALFTAAYNKDVEGVIYCFPEEMEPYAKKLYNAYRTASSGGGWSGDLLYYTTGMFFRFEDLNMDNKYWYEIEEVTEVEEAIEQGIVNPPSESRSVFTNKELQAEYGLTYDEAYIVRVCSKAEYDTIQFGENVHITNGSIGNFEVAKIGKKWYVLRIDHAWDSDWCE